MDNRLHASVAAFWSAGDAAKWASLKEGLELYREPRSSNLVVINSPDCAPAVQDLRPGHATVLGYVATRTDLGDGNYSDPWDWATQVQPLVDAYFTNGSAQVDGIYFDQLCLPQDETKGQVLVAGFRRDNKYDGLKLMILAGGCSDPWLVTGQTSDGHVAPPDYLLLWEDTVWAYRESFSSQEPQSGGTKTTTMPAWWKNPEYRDRIAHTVHSTAQTYDWQDVTGRAVERNVGHLFVMDWRGPNQHDPSTHDAYDHLPAYWTSQCSWADSYNEHHVGLTDAELLRAAQTFAAGYDLGGGKSAAHAWPNFEQQWVSGAQVRGTCYLTVPLDSDGVSRRTVALADLSGPTGVPPDPWDVSSLWGAVHRWAKGQGLKTAIPTFEPPAGGQVNVIAFDDTTYWLSPAQVPLADLSHYSQADPPNKVPPVAVPWQVVEGRYTFAEPGAVIRMIHRAARQDTTKGTGWPTFDANLADMADGGDPTGRMDPGGFVRYDAFFVDTQKVHVQDQNGADYGARIPAPPG